MEHFALGRPVWGPVGEKVLKMNSKWRLHGSVGGVWGPKSRPKGSRTAKRDLVCGHWRARDRHFEEFQTIVQQRCVFLEMWENLGKTCVFFTGSRGSGRQSWGHLGSKVVSKRGQDRQKESPSAWGQTARSGFATKLPQISATQRNSAHLSQPQVRAELKTI